MKRHERCRIGGSPLAGGDGEIPLLSSFLYLFDGAEAGPPGRSSPGQAPRLLALEGGQRGVPASPAPPIRVEDSVRWGVWLGRHICQRLTQVS